MATRPTKHKWGDRGSRERGHMGKAVTGMVREPEVVEEILKLEGIEPDSPIDDPKEKPGPSGPPGPTLHEDD